MSGCVIQLMKISLPLLSDVSDYEGVWVVIPRSINYTQAQLPAAALLPGWQRAILVRQSKCTYVSVGIAASYFADNIYPAVS